MEKIENKNKRYDVSAFLSQLTQYNGRQQSHTSFKADAGSLAHFSQYTLKYDKNIHKNITLYLNAHAFLKISLEYHVQY